MRKRQQRPRPSTAFLLGVLAAVLLVSLSLAADKKKAKTAPQALIAGTVFQESGFSLRGARVVVFDTERPKVRKETLADMQGEFAVRVPGGKARYVIEASADGFVSEKKTVEVGGDERVEVTFRLTPSGK